jgi:hypothetical protein
MAIFFDQKVTIPGGAVHVGIEWHKQFPVLAVASYSEDAGGIVNFFTDEVGSLPFPFQSRTFIVFFFFFSLNFIAH